MSCRPALLVEAALVSVVQVLSAQATVTSKDAYLRYEGNAWTLGTSSFEKKLVLSDGQLVTAFLRNKVARHEYQGRRAPSEIRFRVDGQDVGTPPWSWTAENSRSRQLPQGELQLDLELQGGPLAITKHYLVYPGTALVREWLTVRNRSRAPVRISQLRFLNTIGIDASASPLRLHYITGGGNFNGSQLLKTETVAAGYRRTFDSYRGIQKESYSGYLPLIVLEDPSSGNGLAIGWDYMGHWSFEASSDKGGPAEISLQVAGYDKGLPPGSAIDTPRAFVAISSGDLDKLGNQLLDWQYEYLWDFINPEYFAKTRWAVDWPNPWVGRGGTPSADNWGRRLALDL